MIDNLRTFNKSFAITLVVLGHVAVAIYASFQVSQILSSDFRAADTYNTMKDTFAESDKTELPQIDWMALKESCPNVIGWLYCPDTKLNYPIVQGPDNDFYLTHFADDTYDRHGAVFVDWRNGSDFTDANTLVYGHNMNDGTMFNLLLNWDNADYFAAHPVLFLLTESKNYTVALHNVCVVDTASPVYDLDCGGDKVAWIAECNRKSWVTADFVSAASEPTITFSTCSNHTDRFILQGELQRYYGQQHFKTE